MHWHLIHTKPRQEKIALENLLLQGYSCYLPMLAIEKRSRGKVARFSQPLFPRYLFIQLDRSESGKSWAPIRSTKGVARLVSFGTKPASVKDSLIDVIKKLEQESIDSTLRMFRPGEKVVLSDGPFAGLEATFQMSNGDHRAMILVDFLSRPLAMRISKSNLRKVN
jgi:transcriptional antiterminator RfaH